MRILSYVVAFIMVFSVHAYGEGIYRVKRGDSLYEISKRFHVSIEELKGVNNLFDERLKPGQRLKIPSRADNHDDRSARNSKPRIQNVQSVSRTSSPEFHVVKKGDTLSGIAKRYGISLADLKEINGIKLKRLKIGQKILLKRSGPRTYTVKKGDNIWKIAKRFNMDVEEIMELNELDSDELKPGQRLVLEDFLGTPARIDENEIKRYESAISELKALEDGSDIETVMNSNEAIMGLGLKERLVLFAKKMLNIPYRFGGSSIMGIDCSGYVQKVFGYLNIPLPRTAREQFELGESVSKEELNIGDLVFFKTYASFPSHVGIYLGNNFFIHASSKSRKVTIDSLDAPYYMKRFMGAKRIITESLEQ